MPLLGRRWRFTTSCQVLNYLKANGLPLALLINFGAEKLQWKRIILTPTLK